MKRPIYRKTKTTILCGRLDKQPKICIFMIYFINYGKKKSIDHCPVFLSFCGLRNIFIYLWYQKIPDKNSLNIETGHLINTIMKTGNPYAYNNVVKKQIKFKINLLVYVRIPEYLFFFLKPNINDFCSYYKYNDLSVSGKPEKFLILIIFLLYSMEV